MPYIGKIKYFILHVLKKIDQRFWKIENREEEVSCVLYTTNFWAEDIEKERATYKRQNREAFFDFFLELESKYFYHYKRTAILEPEQGWLIDDQSRTLFSKSFPYAKNPFRTEIFYPKLYKYFNPFKKVTEVEVAISIPYGWDNYFHFFIETLPQFNMINELNIEEKFPVIIPVHSTNFPFVKDFFDLNNILGKRKIIVQESNEYIKIKNGTYLFKDIGYPKEALVKVLNSFKDTSFLNNKGNRKIYLKRGANRQRAISNAVEIEHYVASLGYEIVDAEGMSLLEQINIFSSTSHLIGIHGAGLTNILFRYGRPLEVIEIFPEGHAPEHYKILSKTLGFNYSFVTGLPFDARKQFVLPLERLTTLSLA